MPHEQPIPYDIWIYIKLAEEGQASSDDFDLRGELEETLLDHDLEISGAGSGMGWMDVSLKTNTPDESLSVVIDVLSDYEVMYRSEIGLGQYSKAEENCNQTHTFQAGDALSFQFADGDYGAVLVITRGKDVLPWRDEALVGILDYKSPDVPTKSVFEQRQWLTTTREWQRGQPYFARLGGCSPEKFHKIDHMPLIKDDMRRCQFHYHWGMLAEIVLHERQR